MSRSQNPSLILKISLLATGFSGIVAEYVLSTLASYFLGDSTIQWTMILSTMLFSMGLGSSASKYFEAQLLEIFIGAEFLLSILVAYSAVAAYSAASFASTDTQVYLVQFDAVVIYIFAVAIGFLIGIEIPLVMRLNDAFEKLKINVSAVMEKDYYGSLIGGLFFAFVGLPFLGLTYTPFVLGSVNFVVAVLLLYRLFGSVGSWGKRFFPLIAAVVGISIALGAVFAQSIVEWGEQRRYQDRIVFQKQSRYQKIVVTEWKGHHWLYLNTHQQLSSYDEYLYHEPLVHPAMMLAKQAKDVLILGGGDGCAAREVLKYPSVQKLTLVDLDPEMTRLGKQHPIFIALNDSALHSPKIEVLNQDAYKFMDETMGFFDVMIIDFPDPRTIEIGRLYSVEFFVMCFRHLRPNGKVVVQSGSPYFGPKAFYCVKKTLQAAGFQVVSLHNHVLTFGEWGFQLASKSLSQDQMLYQLRNFSAEFPVPTRWLNSDALDMITRFGKPISGIDTAEILPNKIHQPVLHNYYNRGAWELY
jgi:spermidine synthase